MTLPAHVAIIMDGNGRWAAQRGLARAAGHQEGANTVERIVRAAREQNVRALTLFAFSSENWNRPEAEIQVLLGLFGRALRRQVARLHDNDIRLRFIGERSALTSTLARLMNDAERKTALNTGMDLVVAINYGGRWDIVQAARASAREAIEQGNEPESIDEAVVARHMSLADLPPPDLFIRTGGEQRISNFVLWDLAYSELYFLDQLWPDFSVESFNSALAWYAKRERRFGRVPAAASASL